jgi:adenosylmethionine-8-amino-7-oxononanoate aminotransferase
MNEAYSGGWHPHLWHPFTQPGRGPAPLPVKRGDGVWLELEDGRRLIDGISSWWVTLHGHSEPSIAAAIARQAETLEQVIFANFRHQPATELSERVCALWPGLERMFFSDNGSTAVEVAIKMALQRSWRQGGQRHQVIAFDGAYHGDTFGAMAVGERGLFSAPFEPKLFEVARAPWPATWWGDDACEDKEQQALSQLEQLLETPTAAVILEPLLQGAGGMAMVRPTFLQAVQQRVHQAGALLIADEVLTGFGRCGALFASLRAGITPDLVALSKGLTGGFLPMGVTLASEELYQQFVGPEPECTFFHGHSFTANPLGCAAAVASLELLQARPERICSIEARHQPQLERLAAQAIVKRPRLLGSIAAFELAGASGYLQPIGLEVQRACLSKGLFVRPLGSVVYLMPPLCINDQELEHCYSVLNDVLEQLSARA